MFFNFFKHWLLEIDNHSLHSPYLFNLYTSSIKSAKGIQPDSRIEELRKLYEKDHQIVPGDVFGAGSRFRKKKANRLSYITRRGLSRSKYSVLLLSLINYFKCRIVLELGTSIGLNTLYLSKGKFVEKVITFEGNRHLAEIAQSHFESIPDIQIDLVIGNIDHTFKKWLEQNKRIDFVFLDANHTAEATARYVELAITWLVRPFILVIDDIYWSAGMTKAWNQICSYPQRKLCLDFFQMGILIFDEEGPEGYFHLVY